MAAAAAANYIHLSLFNSENEGINEREYSINDNKIGKQYNDTLQQPFIFIMLQSPII